MTEEEPQYRMKKTIQNGAVKFRRVPITAEDIIAERDEEIRNLKKLVDSLRSKIEQLEQEQQRKALRDAPVDSADSYQIYK
jgi:hypothetical protein